MPATLPELAPILTRIRSIVTEQDRRIDGADPEPGSGLADATDDELDAALHDAGEAACALITDPAITADQRQAARAYLHACLIDYADALTYATRVKAPDECAIAAAELERTAAYARALIAHPRALAMFDALDAAETAAARHRSAHDADEHMASLTAAVDAMRAVRRLGPASAEPYRLEFVVVLGDYLSVRAAKVPYHRDTVARVGAELDDARAELAAAYVKHVDRAAAAASV